MSATRNQAEDRPQRSRARKLGYGAIAITLSLALIEGFCSLGLLAHDFFSRSSPGLARRQHTQYDPELGWVNVPGRSAPDMYGPGRSVTINQRGFRGLREFPQAVPAGVLRILCSGDSFTLGYGVDDRETWCHVLDQCNPRVEVCNMGQGGYGFDQSYLWYQRDGRKLEHQVHLFCLNVWQFLRMRVDEFLGYGKPILKLMGDQITAANVPVPRRAFWVPWITGTFGLLQECRTVELVTRLTGGAAPADDVDVQMPMDQAFRLTIRALEELHITDQQHGSQLLVVWLPVQEEYRPSPSDEMRRRLLKAIRFAGIPVVDLVRDLRELPEPRVEEMFIQAEELNFLRAEGHYNAAGNQFIAERIESYLRQNPQWQEWWE